MPTRTQSLRAALPLLAAAIGSSACAFDEGQPWGSVAFSVSATLDSDGRASDDGYRTSNDYIVRIDSLRVTFDDVRVTMVDANTASFDPGSPPDGYSLCHNGHCHADDGRLVAYEDIATDLTGAAPSAATTHQEIDEEAQVTETPVALALGACSNDCQLGRGRVGLISLSATGATLVATVHDRRTGDRRRLPDEGVTVTLETYQPLTWSAQLSIPIDGHRPPDVSIDASLTLPAGMLDDVDWADPRFADFATALGEGVLLTTHSRSHYD